MTNKKHEDLDLDVALANTTHSVEDFYSKNKKNINTALIVVVLAVAGYFGLKQYYFEPLEQEAQVEMFKAQQMFEIDSFNMLTV